MVCQPGEEFSGRDVDMRNDNKLFLAVSFWSQ